MKYTTIPSNKIIQKTAENLLKNGFTAEIVENGASAKKRALALIPKSAEVMNQTSVTVDTIGLSNVLNESGQYTSVRNTLNAMDRATQNLEMQKLGAAPEYTIGSVHAVTEDGHLLIASSSGSQLPSYVYGASHVIFVVGAQKIVKNIDEGTKRIYEHSLPLEDKRAQIAYGTGSDVRKLLLYLKEKTPGRTHVILVKEALGY